MDLYTANNNPENHNQVYVIWTVVFVILSLLGVFGIVFLFNSRRTTATPPVSPSPTLAALVPTQPPVVSPEPSTPASPVPSKKLESSPTPSVQPTSAPDLSPTPTPEFSTYKNDADQFSVTHRTDRKVYEDKELSGNRYTFYSALGNFAVHTGNSWSWAHPGREFTSDFQIDGQPTFRYDIALQTIVDVKNGDKLYTIQCIHQGKSEQKAECEAFIKSFKLLSSEVK